MSLEKFGCLKNAEDFVLEDVPYSAPANESVSFSMVFGSTICSETICFSILVLSIRLIFRTISFF